VLGPCFGAALFPVNAEDSDALFRAADTALRYAKSDGRTGLAFFDTEMEKRIGRRAALERDIKRALESEEFVLFYQPQLELASGQRRGHEALLRWERPGEGILPPGEFLPVAQETGLIRPLGDWVLRTACRDAATWLDSGTVAVNISAEQFRFQDLPDSIAKALSESGLPAERLEIEVPESLFLQRSPEVMDQLQRIKALGVRVAMDNFGAGYTGLASLAQFHFDKVKVDRSFVGQLTEDSNVAAIVASVVGLGRSLSVDITAEGVETDEQVKLLRAAGCSIVQGFLFGMPSRDKPTATAAAEAAETKQDAAAESTG
jgi:EAL domain-containing protein (putative c-di-GMP-specific phosphodiesterase class I)